MCFHSFVSFFVVLLLNTGVFSAPVRHSEIYVSTNGDDNFEGSLLRPVRSLHRALDLVLSLRKDSIASIEIILRGGRYFLPAGAKIDSFHSSSQTTLTIQNYPNERVVLSGGVQLSGFQKVRDAALLSRLEPTARDSLYFLNLDTQLQFVHFTFPRYGFARNIVPTSPLLYTSISSLPMARWPNTNWATTSLGTDSLHNVGFVFQSERIKKWVGKSGIMVHGFWKYNWADSYENVQSIDTIRHIIFTEAPHGIYGYASNRRFYVFNAFEELDSNGEWYIDKNTRVLYVWTHSPKLLDSLFLSICTEPLLKLTGCSNVTIKGISLEDTRGIGMQLLGTQHCVIDQCTFTNIGMHGISIGENEGNIGGIIYSDPMYEGNAGHDNTIVRCVFKNIGHTAVILGGGDRRTLKSGRNKVVQSTITHCNTISYSLCGGIFMYGVGNEVNDCLISDLPHTAIFFWGNDHVIKGNSISEVCKETGDAGALYIGRDWSQRGSKIFGNMFSNIKSTQSNTIYNEVMSVYLDDFASGTEVANNIFFNVNVGIQIGGGRDNLIEKNIFYQCDVAISFDARGTTWANKFFTGKDSLLFYRLHLVQPNSVPYKQRYPSLINLPSDRPELPLHNIIQRNVAIKSNFLRSSDQLDTLITLKNNYRIKNYSQFSKNSINSGLDSVYKLINFEPISTNTK